MDSGNSGSMQSSSGGDEEYDSCAADSISSLFNPTMSSKLPQPRQQHHHSFSPATMFDPGLQNYHLDPISQPPLPNPNSLHNPDTAWSKTQRPEPNIITQAQQPIYGSQAQPHGPFTASSPSPTVPFRPVTENSTHVARNPKKRSRASRRAPTTVLTTDTTNFRAMVQEFTGIPAPPFTTSSPFPRGRLDIFGAPYSIRSNPLDSSQPPYLLRPFAQKVQQPRATFLSSSSSSLLDSSMANSNNFTSGLASNSSYDQLGLYRRPPFQSLLQSPTLKYPQPNSSIFGSKTQESLEIPSNESIIKMGVFDDFGLTHTHRSGPLNLVSPEGTAWRTDSFPTSLIRVSSSNGDEDHLRSVNGDFDFSRNFRSDKGQNSNSTREQGMVEPWVCSSD